MLGPRAVAHALGGGVAGPNAVLAPGPGHSRRDRSLSVKFDPRAPDGFVVYSFAGDDPILCRDHVRRCVGMDRFIAPTKQPGPPRTGSLDIWHEARDPRGTGVETYLAKRGLVLPAGAAGGALKVHPSCPIGGDEVSGLVALGRNGNPHQPGALH